MLQTKEYIEQAILVNEQELAYLKYDYSTFYDGKESVDASHSFSLDLDIFGQKSLFHSINRTTTCFGQTQLINFFSKPFDSKADILSRQEAINELSKKKIFRQEYRINGLLYKGTSSDGKELISWITSSNHFHGNKYYLFLSILVPVVNLILILLSILHIVSYLIPCFFIFFFLTCSIGLTQHISKVQSLFDKKLHILKTYGKLLSLIENEKFTHHELLSIQNRVISKDTGATTAIHKLIKRMDALDQRNNIFVTAVLNGLFFWELQQIIQIESWKSKYGIYLKNWLSAIGDIDALCSLATFAYNNPSFTYPFISKTPCFKAKKLKHPLMNRDKCIANDIDIAGTPHFIIVTGANMAGKSTYLRTIGVNHLLGCMGMPVDAEEMTLYPAHLITSLRTNDSLTDNESYFFAELKRLKMILNRLQQDEQVFVILDEILRGTNSVDKQKGSYSFLKELILSKTSGLIATHDLQLACLKNSFPNEIDTKCFEADIINNELHFSYKIRDGIAKNMNACFLMKKMGIEID